MENYPIQLVMNASDYEKDEKRPPGHRNKRDYYAGKDEEFRLHRERFAEQLTLFAAAQTGNPYTKMAYAKVLLKPNAIAKSYRPTEKVLNEKNGCKVVGGGKKGEMFVRFSPSSVEKIKAVAETAEAGTTWVINNKGKKEAKPSPARSEVGAINDVLPITAEDKCGVTAEEIVAYVKKHGTGYLYVELFENTLDENLKTADDVQEQRKMFGSFKQGLQEIPGIRAYKSSLGRRNYVIMLTNSAQSQVNLRESLVESATPMQEPSTDVMMYDALLDFLTSHPVVKTVSLPPVVQGVPTPAFNFDEDEVASISKPEHLENYPLIGVADSGVAAALEDWVVARVDNLMPKHKDATHGTFIAGMHIIGKRLNPTFIKERDGNRLVDICVLPKQKDMRDAYPLGLEDFVENLRNSVRQAVDDTGVRVIGLSMNLQEERKSHKYSDLAEKLDEIATENNVIFVISAGNLLAPHKEWNPCNEEVNIKEFTSRKDDIVYAPAESLRNISVGALNPPNNLGMASYSCKGKGLETATKPDLVHVGGFGCDYDKVGRGLYSIDADGGIITWSGTSFSAPIVAKTLAALDHLTGGTMPRETLMALAIHNSIMPDAFKSKKYKRFLKDWIGFGQPLDAESILNGNEHSISLVFHHTIKKGKEYYFQFSWPKSLIKDGRCIGHVKVTLVSTPLLDYSYTEELVREDISVSLHQVDKKGKSLGTKLKPIFYVPNDKKEKVTLNEEERRDGYYKWNPVKVYDVSFPIGFPVDAGPWCLEAKYWKRDDEMQNDQGVEFTIIMTIDDPNGQAPVYNDMRQELKAMGVNINDIQAAVRAMQRV